MIDRPRNWNEVKAFEERQKLPLGAYVCRVKKAAVNRTDYGDQLCVLFDITEGEYAGYYADDYNGNQNEDKKWRGVLRQWIPRDDGSEKDEWTKRSFKGFINAFEESNTGFTWNWDENSLAKLEVGILFRNEEWDYNGKHGWAVRPFRAIPADAVRSGEYKLPNDKPLNIRPAYSVDPMAQTANVHFEELDDDGDLPF